MSASVQDIVRNEFKSLLRDDHPPEFDAIPLADLGVDSLDFFEVAMILEDEHGIIIPETELHSDISLQELFALLA